jgi:hypothetical protein
MSQRAAAKLLGVDQKTISRDMRQDASKSEAGSLTGKPETKRGGKPQKVRIIAALMCGKIRQKVRGNPAPTVRNDCAKSAQKSRTKALARRSLRGYRRLALLWQIYSRRFSIPIHFRQCGHRFDGS